MHIKAAAHAACDRRGMKDIRAVLADTIACASGGDWAGYRARFAALRDAIGRTRASAGDEVRRHLETLGAAAPEHDVVGCIAELQALSEALGAEALAALAAADAPPALDLRGLRPPEPIVRIFDALQRAPCVPLRVILPHEPVPLYRMLAEQGFSCSGEPTSDGGYELVIERA